MTKQEILDYFSEIDFMYNHAGMHDDLSKMLDKLLENRTEQKFFVDSDGKMTPLPIQKHGHWEIVQDYYDDEHWQCSACGCEWYLEAGNPEENNMHYCPECGARMDEEVKQDG